MSGEKFAILGFVQESSIEVIPTSWIISKTEAKWPKCSSISAISKSILQCAPVADDWICPEIKVYGYSSNY